jgi:cytochrome P450
MTTSPQFPTTGFDPVDSSIGSGFTAYSYPHANGCPVVHSDARGGFWLVAGNAAARAVLGDPKRFRSGDGALFPDPGMEKIVPLEYDGEEHKALRRIFTAMHCNVYAHRGSGTSRPSAPSKAWDPVDL